MAAPSISGIATKTAASAASAAAASAAAAASVPSNNSSFSLYGRVTRFMEIVD
jgi:hypothetical protein